MMAGKALDRENHRSSQSDQEPLGGRSFAAAGMPDGGGEKTDEPGYQRPKCFHENPSVFLVIGSRLTTYGTAECRAL
jgi:hypothetical protein